MEAQWADIWASDPDEATDPTPPRNVPPVTPVLAANSTDSQALDLTQSGTPPPIDPPNATADLSDTLRTFPPRPNLEHYTSAELIIKVINTFKR
ncbi:hypothetical protein N7466_003265 [Penicillium verhagenii]|uniref:uncharacterized protein n=1 Tax=Penicillium verhagenii TaxID=1562060 RepID=UPI00254561A8|nr:uncharacterized protein N7466_003265 [Penicillium verhagenii]KAJ5936815.1 hypothetical protein N7466_003265 [Penicillium verhagenii]